MTKYRALGDIPGYRDAEMPGYRDAWIPGWLDVEMPDARIAICLDARCRDAGMPGWLYNGMAGIQYP